jgi:hypothetical protein
MAGTRLRLDQPALSRGVAAATASFVAGEACALSSSLPATPVKGAYIGHSLHDVNPIARRPTPAPAPCTPATPGGCEGVPR